MSQGPASVPRDGGAHTARMVSTDNSVWIQLLGGSWPCTATSGLPAAPFQESLPNSTFLQPVHVAGLERPVPSVATAHLVPPATMLLGSAIVHLASLDLAVSRVGALLTSTLWRGTMGFLRARPGLTLPNLYPACQPGTFGKDCGHLCQCSGETWACHPASGACVCAAGYHGTNCQQRECCPLPRGTWGSVCHSGMQGGGWQLTGWPCHVQGCCMLDSSPQLM